MKATVLMKSVTEADIERDVSGRCNDRTILETKSIVKESKTELTEQLYCFGKNNSGESVGDTRAREYCVSCRTTEHTTSGTTPGKNTWHIAWHGRQYTQKMSIQCTREPEPAKTTQ